MPDPASAVANRRRIIDRPSLSDRILACGPERRPEVVAMLKEALASGRAEIARRLEERPYAGSETAAAYAFLTDQILRLAYDYVTMRLYPLANPTASERLLLMAVGGYGRGEMALHSDVDIAFLTPWKPTDWTEQAVEAMLYLLWDLGLKIGQSTRSVDEMIGSPPPTTRSAPPSSNPATSGATSACATKRMAASGRKSSPATSRSSSPASSRSAMPATSGWATAATSSNPISRKGKAAFAICTRSSGSGNMPFGCARSRSWSKMG